MLKIIFKDNFNLFYSPFRFQKGFTLLEMVTVVAVMLLLTSIVIVNHREGQRRFILQRATHKVAQDIRVAQEMAVSGRECPECGVADPDGYGIFFDKNDNTKYIIYAETGGGGFYTGSPPDTDIEIVNLEQGIFISDINSAPGKASINFRPPEPEITIKWSSSNNQSEVIITLALKAKPTETKTITVNTVGLIDID